MVQILPGIPSFGETVGRNLGEGLSSGLSTAQKLAGSRYKAQTKKMEQRQKLAGRAFKDLPAWLKTHHDVELRPEELNQLEGIYENIVTSQVDLPEQDARRIALEMWDKSRLAEKHSDIASKLRGSETPEQIKFRQHLGRFTPEERAQEINPWGAASAIKRNPKQAFAQGVADIGVAPLEIGLSLLNSKGYSGAIGKLTGEQSDSRTPLADLLKKKAGIGELDPDTQHQLDKASIAASLSNVGGLASKGIGALRGFFGKSSSAAKSATKLLGSKIAPAEAAAAEFSPAAQAIKESSLAGKVTKRPNNATELRMNRVEPGNKLSPVKEIVKQRQEQLKKFPKYAEEIAKDAAEREARRAAKIPKTAVGEAGLAKRIAIAESKLPNIESAYTRATARVRALENQISKTTGEAKNAYTELYDVAKNELKEAQVDLQRARSNLRGDSEKYTVEEATKRARAKVDSITDAIQEGKEVKLSARDYSPRMIAQAKELSKKKKLSHMKGDDFYNQIHEDYLKPYRSRLEQVNKDLKSSPIMFNAEGHAALKKEKEVLGKMIESAEAEQVIHNHKLAIREINETKKASDRFSQLKQGPKEPKVSQVANEKMWRNQIREARTSQERAKVIDEGVEQAAKAHPDQADKILKEGQSLKKEADSLFENVRGKIPDPKQAKDFSKKVSESIMNFKMTYPKLARYGQEILVGVATAVYDDIKKEYDLPIGAGTIASAVLGNSRGAWIRVMTNQITKAALKKWHVSKAKDQYLSNDPVERRKWMKQPESVKRKAKKEIRAS